MNRWDRKLMYEAKSGIKIREEEMQESEDKYSRKNES